MLELLIAMGPWERETHEEMIEEGSPVGQMSSLHIVLRVYVYMSICVLLYTYVYKDIHTSVYIYMHTFLHMAVS